LTVFFRPAGQKNTDRQIKIRGMRLNPEKVF